MVWVFSIICNVENVVFIYSFKFNSGASDAYKTRQHEWYGQQSNRRAQFLLESMLKN